MTPTHLRLCAALAIAALAAGPARAQMLSDAALQAPYAAQRHDELQRLASARVAARADDEQAVLALALAALASNKAAARQAAIGAAEACLARQAQAAACHYALGSVLGVQAMTEGMMAAARSVGRVREALTRAHELAPAWYPARSALVEFHVLAPGMLGGSRAKAAELARSAPQADEAQALQARVALADDKPAEALKLLELVRPGRDSALDDDLFEWVGGAGFALLNAGQPAAARPAFERLVRIRPDSAVALYGLARVASESGAPADALPLFERSRRAKGADALPIDYRQGIAQQALGQSDAARASLNRFVAAGKGPKKSLDDAKKRLDQLGS